MNGSEIREKNKVNGGTLYLVATPIGNMADLSERAIKVLSEVDFLAAEDTRNSMRLLSLLGVSKPMIPYHEHNRKEKGPVIIAKLKEGQSCALVTDAGTPAVSDPGADLVKLCIEENIPVTSVPGCCAAINALILSGMDTHKFVFEGFIEGTEKKKREAFSEMAAVEKTVILYEAPHRLCQTLSLLEECFGENRKIALCREMTKLNEEILRTTLAGAVEHYRKTEPRGEYVLILEGKSKDENRFFENMTLEEHMQFYLDNGLTKMDAMKAVAKDRGVGKSEIYKKLMS